VGIKATDNANAPVHVYRDGAGNAHVRLSPLQLERVILALAAASNGPGHPSTRAAFGRLSDALSAAWIAVGNDALIASIAGGELAPEVVEHELGFAKVFGPGIHSMLVDFLAAMGAMADTPITASVFAAMQFIRLTRYMNDDGLMDAISDAVDESIEAHRMEKPAWFVTAAAERDRQITRAAERYIKCECHGTGNHAEVKA